MGQRWNALFGAETYSFDHKGVHFVVLMSVQEKDFWTAGGLSPAERMHTVAGLDNALQSAFEVGAPQRGERCSGQANQNGSSNSGNFSRSSPSSGRASSAASI